MSHYKKTRHSANANMEMNRNSSNSTNQYGVIGSGIISKNASSGMTPQSALDVEDSPMFYYHNNNSYGGISSQNSEDVKMLKSIQKKSKRRLNMEMDEDIEDADSHILFNKAPNLNFD